MAQASVLSESDIRRVFRIIETTRYADRNRLAFVLSIYAGMRIGEIATLKINDVQGNLRFDWNSDFVAFRSPDICDKAQCEGRRNADYSKTNGTSPHRDNGFVL